jgi:hypothetical protein
MAARVTINGVSYSGMNVSVSNNRVFVDGKEVNPEGKEIRISVEGDIGKLDVDSCDRIDVSGSVKGNVNVSAGNASCGDVGGNVETTAGNVTCGAVSGNVHTMAGNISRK